MRRSSSSCTTSCPTPIMAGSTGGGDHCPTFSSVSLSLSLPDHRCASAAAPDAPAASVPASRSRAASSSSLVAGSSGTLAGCTSAASAVSGAGGSFSEGSAAVLCAAAAAGEVASLAGSSAASASSRSSRSHPISARTSTAASACASWRARMLACSSLSLALAFQMRSERREADQYSGSAVDSSSSWSLIWSSSFRSSSRVLPANMEDMSASMLACQPASRRRAAAAVCSPRRRARSRSSCLSASASSCSLTMAMASQYWMWSSSYLSSSW
mmetsp:Transcript_20738/g.62477  ORF Transcript_20738/g.62477 Transcript_20738/m.62477 type:complete len:271 (+) Transcript_20738:916-1728(+)